MLVMNERCPVLTHTTPTILHQRIYIQPLLGSARNLLASWQRTYLDSWGHRKSKQPGALQSISLSYKFSSSSLLSAHFFCSLHYVYNGQNVIQSHNSVCCSSSWKMLSRCLRPVFRPCVHTSGEPQTSSLSCPGSHWWTLSRAGSCL